jgi:hypothetical protein
MEAVLITTLDQRPPVDRPQSVITVLRKRLIQLNVWPEAGDIFLELLPVSSWHDSPLTSRDYHWLHQVVEDAIEGIDIGSRYPSFFQKLVVSHDLGQTFLDELDKRLDET